MTEKNIHSEDQIDLSGIRATLLDLLRIFFKGLAFLGFCLKKHKFIVTLFLVLGMSLGYVYYATKPSHYKATMIVQFNKLTKRTYSEMVDQLNHLLATSPTERLARELHVSKTVAGKLLSVQALDMEDHYLGSDTSTKVDQPFKIAAYFRDDFDFALDSLQSGILNYLNNSPYLVTLTEEQQKANQFKLAAIDNDLAKLDTLKTEFNHFIASSKISATVYNNATNPGDFYAQTINLLLQRDKTIKDLNVDKLPVAVLDGFKLTETPGFSAVPRYIVVFGLVTGFLAFFVLVVVETRHRVMGRIALPTAPGQK